MRSFSLFVCLFSFFLGFSQSQDKSLWRDYLPYSEVKQIVKKGSIVYASTPYALFSYDTEDNSLETISKSDKLSDFGVASIAYNSSIDAIIVGYSNGNLDVLTNTETINIPAILNSSLVADKTIYSLYAKEAFVYASTGFGIVKIDLTKMEVADTYFVSDDGSPLKVNAITTDDNYIYAATQNGLRKAEVNSTFLADFSQWRLDESLPNHTEEFSSVIMFQNKPFVTYNSPAFLGDTLYFYDENWQKISALDGLEIRSVTTNSDHLVVTTSNKIFVFDENLNSVREIEKDDSVYAIIDSDQIIWQGAAFFEGLIKHEANGTFQSLFPSGPPYSEAFTVAEVMDGFLWVATGGVTAAKGFPTFNNKGIMRYNGVSWSSFNSANVALMDSLGFTDYLYITANPNNPNHVIFTNYRRGGMFEILNEEVFRYDASNSSLQLTENDEDYNLGDVKFDNDNYVWVANSRVANPLSVKTPDNQWKSFYCGPGLLTSRFTELIIDSRGYKWMVSPTEVGGVVVYNDNNTPLDDTDDEYKRLTISEGSGNLPNTSVWSITEDFDGQIWLGTEEGIAVIYNPSAIFSEGNFDAAQILIEQGENIEILLGAERITSMTIDGANRKWVGTANSGVYCFSADGIEQAFHFTEDNSPLFSNNINDVKINSKLGEVVIASSKGLQAFKTEVSFGSTDFSSIYAYPNPVRPEYSGKIFVNGLMRDSDVKITDISGNLVYETTSLGGQAVWDGNDKFGNRVTTGVYLVFVAAPDGSQAEVTKILFVK